MISCSGILPVYTQQMMHPHPLFGANSQSTTQQADAVVFKTVFNPVSHRVRHCLC